MVNWHLKSAKTKEFQAKAVGGEIEAVNKLGALAPWILLAFVLSIGGAMFTVNSLLLHPKKTGGIKLRRIKRPNRNA
jgi:hypothetical protein